MNSDNSSSLYKEQGYQSSEYKHDEVEVEKPMVRVVPFTRAVLPKTMPPPPKYCSCLYTEYIPNKKFKKC